MFLLPMDNRMLGAGMSELKSGCVPQEFVIVVFCTVGIAYSLDTEPVAVRNVSQMWLSFENARTMENV